MKILVTGAAGFVGRHVARTAARAGHTVVGIGNGSWSKEEWRAFGLSDWRACPVTIDNLMTYSGQPDVIFHCAGSGSVPFSLSYPFQDYQRTVATTHATLEYIRLVHPEAKLVLPSSAGVYGNAPVIPIPVLSPTRPASPYGTHKLIAEKLTESYCANFGVCGTVVRLFSVYGTGLRKQLLWDACGKITSGDLVFAGTGEEMRDWLHIEDAAALLLEASLHADVDCPTVNGGTGKANSISQVVGTLCDALGAVHGPVFSGVSRGGDPTRYEADMSDTSGWNWRPERHLETEVRNYAKWFKDGAP